MGTVGFFRELICDHFRKLTPDEMSLKERRAQIRGYKWAADSIQERAQEDTLSPNVPSFLWFDSTTTARYILYFANLYEVILIFCRKKFLRNYVDGLHLNHWLYILFLTYCYDFSLESLMI